MRWPSPFSRLWTAVAVGGAVVAALVAGYARPVVFDLLPENPARSVRRFADAREVEVDPRPFWARIPRFLPASHALRFPLGERPARPLTLYLDTDADEEPTPRVTVAVNGAPLTTVALPPASRARVRIPGSAFRGAAPVQLSIVTEPGPAVSWRRIRLVEGDARFALAHLARRGRFPPESAVFLAASLAALLVPPVAGSARSWPRRVLAAVVPGAALLMLGASLALPLDSPLVARVPRWLWLALPWVAAPFRLRPLPPAAPAVPLSVRARSLALGALLSLAALTVSLLLGELALRFVFRDVKSAGDTRTYFHRAYASEPTYEANSRGFREREFPLSKPSGIYRLAVIGDSFTFGGGIATSERFSNQLERRLTDRARPGLTYEVLNFGRAGADTEHEVRTLRALVLRAEPDFVLLQWYVNDVENGDHRGRPTPRMLLPSWHLHLALLRSSALYSLLDHQWGRLQDPFGLIESHTDYMLRRFADPDGPDSVYAEERLKEFIDECRRHDTPVGIVLFPRVGPDLAAGNYEYAYLHDRVLEVCRDEGITCLDLRGPFAAYPDYKQLWVTPLDGHPSALANRLAADRLMEVLGDRWLAASPRAR